MFSHAPWVPPTCRGSQVPRSVCRHAPSPITPAGPVAAYARSSPPAAGFTHLRKVGRPATGLTRPNRVHLRYGSRLRLGRLRRPDCSKTGISSGQTPLRRLHAVRAIHMADSFHSARLTRLNLAHRSSRRKSQRRSSGLRVLRALGGLTLLLGSERAAVHAEMPDPALLFASFATLRDCMTEDGVPEGYRFVRVIL